MTVPEESKNVQKNVIVQKGTIIIEVQISEWNALLNFCNVQKSSLCIRPVCNLTTTFFAFSRKYLCANRFVPITERPQKLCKDIAFTINQAT